MHLATCFSHLPVFYLEYSDKLSIDGTTYDHNAIKLINTRRMVVFDYRFLIDIVTSSDQCQIIWL